jgi:chemotaxis protein methyltransferase CheR
MPVSPEILDGVARRLAEHAGLELPDWVIQARVTARMAATGLDERAYLQLIDSGRGAGELSELVEAVRVGESRLFRHRSHIALLTDAIAPLLRASGPRAIRVWSAGCAAGEEPYTLAVVLARALPGYDLRIQATDVSADALDVARAGRYPASALADVPEEWRDAFVRDGEQVCVRPELAELVTFERANLVDGAAPRHCDLVWCRNVLIYFTPAARKRVIDRLIAATRIGGFVFVGYSESLRDVPGVEAVRSGDAVYYVRRERASTPALGMPVVRPTPTRPPPSIATPPPMLLPKLPPAEDVLVLRGHPAARDVTAELMARLGVAGISRLVVDLDRAELLGDELAPVLRRARAAAGAAHVVLELRATRAGARRWLARHGLDEEGPP